MNNTLPPSDMTDAPIGIFDSGVGGLSVLRHIRQQLPQENLIYLADSAFAPYGDKPETEVIARVKSIATFLLRTGHCKALVVACNTATAAAIHLLREHYLYLPIVGIEPGLKPAIQLSKSGIVGVMATERTLKSAKFRQLEEKLHENTDTRFITRACHGLADLIEHSHLQAPALFDLVEGYTLPLLEAKADTLVLGCTHYPFIQHMIVHTAHKHGYPAPHLVDTGKAVTRQLVRVLEQHQLLRSSFQHRTGTLIAYTTGDPDIFSRQFTSLLGWDQTVLALELGN